MTSRTIRHNEPPPPVVRWPAPASCEDFATAVDGWVVDCWAVDLGTEPPGLSGIAAHVLSAVEQERAAAFYRDVDRAAFRASHTALRLLLSGYLEVGPAEVRIDAEPSGRPVLGGTEAPLHFNLSHSGRLALVAVSRSAPVGVDVEAVVTIPDADAVARDHFAADERRGLEDLGPERAPAGFFVTWTRKEAVVKALGLGLPFGFDRFSTGSAGSPPALALPGCASADWTLVDLEPAAGYAGALATCQPEARIRCRYAAWGWLMESRQVSVDNRRFRACGRSADV